MRVGLEVVVGGRGEVEEERGRESEEEEGAVRVADMYP